jgi:hypothetical protein
MTCKIPMPVKKGATLADCRHGDNWNLKARHADVERLSLRQLKKEK